MHLRDLFESSDLTFREEMRGYSHGQSDVTLYAIRDGETVGWIEYGIYGRDVSIQMIKVGPKRQGIGTALVRELQRRYPDIEIEWGLMSDEGSKLYNSLRKQEVIDPELQAMTDELRDLKKREAELEAAAERFSTMTDAEKEKLTSSFDEWNRISDRIRELEQSLWNRKVSKTLIR